MKKSELKSLIQRIVTETRRLRTESLSGDDVIDQLNMDGPADMGNKKRPTGGAHPGATPSDDEINLDSGYDLEDPKHPTWADRAADNADFTRDVERDSMLEDKKLGVSTMKKSPDKKKNTQMGYEDKTITSTDKPTEKKEGKKLPIIQKKSNTETNHRADKGSTPMPPAGEKKEGKALPVGGHGAKGLKEEILKMVRESIEEMARTKGALGKTNPNRTAPLKSTGVNYKKVGGDETPDAETSGEPATPTINTSAAATARTEGAVEEFLKYNPNASSQEILASITDSNTEETPYNLSPDAISKAMKQSKTNAAGSEETGPTDADIKNVSKQKYAGIRNRLLRARGLAPK